MTNRMRTLWGWWAVAAFAALAVTSCSTAEKSKGTVELFNGKNLEGWKCVLAEHGYTLEQVWTVQDGILNCTGKPVGFLYRGPEVRDFRMEVEYRWPAGTEPSNSGIFSRIARPFQALPCTVEVQLKHGNAGDVLGLQGKRIASGQARFFEVKKHVLAGDIAGVSKLLDAENPAGEWNRVEMLARAGHYQVWINSKLVNDVEGVDQSPGPVAIQSEGGPIQFRRISLTPLE